MSIAVTRDHIQRTLGSIIASTPEISEVNLPESSSLYKAEYETDASSAAVAKADRMMKKKQKQLSHAQLKTSNEPFIHNTKKRKRRRWEIRQKEEKILEKGHDMAMQKKNKNKKKLEGKKINKALEKVEMEKQIESEYLNDNLELIENETRMASARKSVMHKILTGEQAEESSDDDW